MIDRLGLIKVQNYLLRNMARQTTAACDVADIVGVYFGVKPTAINDFSSMDLEKVDLDKFADLVRKLGLKISFERHMVDATISQMYFISKSDKKLCELQEDFHKLWDTAYDAPEKPSLDAEIGLLLGYPETAVRYYTHRDRSKALSEASAIRGARNRHFAHSQLHEDEEFRLYDAKIHRAMDKYTPRAAKILKSDKSKRWL